MKLRKHPTGPITIKESFFEDGTSITTNEQEGEIEYSKEKILSGKEAYCAMLEFFSQYLLIFKDENAAECRTRMLFDEDDTHYCICFELWEKIVIDMLEKKDKDNKK